MRAALLVGALLVTITSYTEAGITVYVDADATGPLHDGSSWCSAYLDLQQALAVAVAGTEIRVAQGVYRPAPAGGSRDAAFAVPSDVTLLGSFQGCGTADPDERDYILYATVLSGDLDGDDDPNFANRTDNVYHVVTTHDVTAATVLDGLTIRGGHADGANSGASVDSRDQGSGVNNYYGQPTLSNCTLVDNYSTNHGAFNNHGCATLINCEFRDNWSGNVAAGLYMHFDTETTVIDCEFHDNTTAGRGGGAYLKGGSGPSFSGCLFSGNHALLGGGMYCDSNSNPTLDNCTFNSNEASPDSGRGGGVYAQNTTVNLVGCTFQGNETSGVPGGGGAIYIDNGTLHLDQCDFLNNRTTGCCIGPAGVYLNRSTATMTRCLFDGNSGSRYGGAMRITASDLTAEDCVFNQNHSYWGAVYSAGTNAEFSRCRFTGQRGNYGAVNSVGTGEIIISDSVFLDNAASQWDGAALALRGVGPYVVTNTLFAGNFAAFDGGAIALSGPHLSLINCVFSGNSAGSKGGAIRLDGGPSGTLTTISNCTFFGHSADSGRAIAIVIEGPGETHELIAVNSIFWNGGSEIWEDPSGGASTTITYSDIEGGWPGVGNIAINPAFVDPAGFDEIVGTVDDNLRLQSGSPCVDSGGNSVVTEATDLDGLPRIVDGDGDAFAVVDMGPYEYAFRDCNTNGEDDSDELAAGTSLDCDGNGVPDECDLDTDGDGAIDACEIEAPILATPPHAILKNRYISIDPRGAGGVNAGRDFDIRLTLSTTLVSGVTAIGSEWWANAPDTDCIAVVGPTRPVIPPNWGACPTLHLTGCPIIPTSSYDIVTVGGSLTSDPPLSAETQSKPGAKWHGDAVGFFTGIRWTAPQGTVNIDDAVAAIKTFQNPAAFNATHVSVTDVHPNLSGTQINKVVNFDDVFVQILGFQGNEYPGTQIELCPDP